MEPEALDLKATEVRLVRPDEMARWRELMNRHHYLGFDRIVGESLHYVATLGGRWVGLIGWGSAALKCAARDRWIGWKPALQFQRLHLIANDVRFLVLPEYRRPNLASRLLAQNAKRLSADWERRHGHPVLLAETFVDRRKFAGVCYRAAGWQVLGSTGGYSKNNRRFWKNGRPKWILARPLTKNAAALLRADFPSPRFSISKGRSSMIDVNRLPLEGEGGLIEMLRDLVDPRKPRGIRHPLSTVVAVAVCAVLSGARSYCAVADWAKGLAKESLRKPGSERPEPPSEPAIRRVSQNLDAEELDRRIGFWLMDRCPSEFRAFAVDGKTMRGTREIDRRPVHLLAAITRGEGVVVGQTAIEEKSNEIPALPKLLEPLPLEGAVVTADAMHTQAETARFPVEEKGADYLFIAKGNQPTLQEDVADLNLGAFPPGRDDDR